MDFVSRGLPPLNVVVNGVSYPYVTISQEGRGEFTVYRHHVKELIERLLQSRRGADQPPKSSRFTLSVKGSYVLVRYTALQLKGRPEPVPVNLTLRSDDIPSFVTVLQAAISPRVRR